MINVDDVAFAIVKTVTRFPRGGFFTARTLARALPGLRLYPVPTDYGTIHCDLSEAVCFPLIEYGRYPHWTGDVETFDRITTPDSLVIDIGANIGVTTKLFADRARQVHAFEPSPRAFPMLRANSPANVEVHAVALSDRAGTIHFKEEAKLDLSAVSDTGVEVPVRILDSYNLKPDVIKIDVEGHEPQALRGARETLGHRPVILFEALTDEARDECQSIICSVYPAYRFERIGVLNYLATPG